MCGMTGNTSVVPGSNAFRRLSYNWRDHEDVVTPDPTSVIKKIDIREIVQHASFPTIDPVDLIVMRTRGLNDACCTPTRLRYPEFFTASLESERFSEILK